VDPDTHDNGRDEVYACARYCAGCLLEGIKGSPQHPSADCALCADTEEKKEKCDGRKEIKSTMPFGLPQEGGTLFEEPISSQNYYFSKFPASLPICDFMKADMDSKDYEIPVLCPPEKTRIMRFLYCDDTPNPIDEMDNRYYCCEDCPCKEALCGAYSPWGNLAAPVSCQVIRKGMKVMEGQNLPDTIYNYCHKPTQPLPPFCR